MPKKKDPTNETGRASAVQHVLDEIVNAIIRGELAPGDQLPTEPELSQKYGVGRNSVREAIKQLQAFGVVYIRRPDGTFVADSFTRKMMDPLLYSLIFKKKDWDDFVQLRTVIDIGTLYVALADPEVICIVPYLRDIVNKMEEEISREDPDVDKLCELDFAFHSRISNSIKNPQVESVNDYVTRLTVPSRREAIVRWISDDERDLFVSLHRQIADVIEKRDTTQIVRVVEEHYIKWKQL